MNRPVPVAASPRPMNAPSAAPRTRIVRITPLLDRYAPAAHRAPGAGLPSLARTRARPRPPSVMALRGDPGRIAERGPDRLGQGPDDDDPETVRAAGAPRLERGTIARVNPRRAASRSRRSSPPTERSSPRRPTSPIATVPGTSGRSRSDEAGRVRAAGRARARDMETAREVGVDVVAGQADPRPPAEHGDEQRQPVGIHARRRAAGAAARRSARRAPAPRRAAGGSPPAPGATTLPGAGASCSARNARAGSDTSSRPLLPHLEDADLLGRAKPVLGGPQQAQPARPVALDRQDHVHQVLERLGARQRPVLGHVADEHDRQAVRPSPAPSVAA